MKKLPLKVAHNQPKSFISVLQTGPKPARISFFSHKNVSLSNFYRMTLKQSYATVKIQLRLIKEFSPIFFFTVDASIDII